MASSQSQGLNLHDNQALHSLLQKWITQQSKVVTTTDQADQKASPDLDDVASRTPQPCFSPNVVSSKSSNDAPSGISPESSSDPNQRANMQEVGGRSSAGKRTFRAVIGGLIIAAAGAAAGSRNTIAR
jgi:hypothetical protein